MQPPTDPCSFSELAQHEDFVRRLAFRLCDDPDLASDAVQETWVAAWRKAPVGIWSRAWLARVVRSKVATLFRRRARQAEQEVLSYSTTNQPDPSETAAERSICEALASLVGELAPHYREAIELSFFHGMPPAQMAEHLGIEVETCRTRVRRAVELLRVRLDAENGSQRERWLAALAPLVAKKRASRPGVKLAPALGIAAVATVSTVMGFFLLRDAPLTEALPRPPRIMRPEQASDLALREVPTAEPRARAGAEGALRVRVMRGGVPLEGLGVSIAEVAGLSPKRHLPTDMDGSARFTELPVGDWAVSLGPGFSEVVAVEEETSIDFDLGPRLVPLSVTVRDPDGNEMAGAEVYLSKPEARSDASSVGVTDERGKLRVGVVDSLASVHAELAGRLLTTQKRIGDHVGPRSGADWVELTLVGLAGAQVRYVVVDPSDRPVEGARISFELMGAATVELGEDGRAQWRPPFMKAVYSARDGGVELFRPRTGKQRIVVEAEGLGMRSQFTSRNGDSPGETLQLGPNSRLPGRVTRGGTPVEGAEVIARFKGREVLRTISGTDGGFVLEGLPQQVRARTRWRDEQGWWVADVLVDSSMGEPVTLQLERAQSVHGCVADQRGEPVAGAFLRFAPNLLGPLTDLERALCESPWEQEERTDAKGRFDFHMWQHRPGLVLATHGDLSQWAIASPAGPERGIVLRLDESASSTAKVVTEIEPAEQVHNATVHLLSMEHAGAFTASSNGRGRFESERLPLGNYQLVASVPGLGLRKLRRFTLDSADAVEVVRFDLSSLISFRVSWSGLEEAEVREVLLLREADEGFERVARVRSPGHQLVEFEGVGPGAYTLSFEGRRLTGVHHSVDVETPGRDLSIALPQLNTIEVFLGDERAEGGSPASLVVLDASGRTVRVSHWPRASLSKPRGLLVLPDRQYTVQVCSGARILHQFDTVSTGPPGSVITLGPLLLE